MNIASAAVEVLLPFVKMYRPWFSSGLDPWATAVAAAAAAVAAPALTADADAVRRTI